MPIRGYLSPWVTITLPDEGIENYARIMSPGSYISDNGLAASAIDLRTSEQKDQIPAEGWALVLTNVTPPQHNQIVKEADTHEVDAGTTVAEVRAIIGDEATDDVLDGSNLEQLKAYFVSCHRGRMARWRQGRF